MNAGWGYGGQGLQGCICWVAIRLLSRDEAATGLTGGGRGPDGPCQPVCCLELWCHATTLNVLLKHANAHVAAAMQAIGAHPAKLSQCISVCTKLLLVHDDLSSPAAVTAALESPGPASQPSCHGRRCPHGPAQRSLASPNQPVVVETGYSNE